MPQALLLAGAAAGEFAGAAAGEASAHAVCIQSCWQELPPARQASASDSCVHCCWQEPPFSRHRHMPFAPSDVGRCCRRRGLSTCRGHPLLLVGAAVGEASVHAACRHCRWQVLPPARNKRMPLASIVVGRSCRRRGLSTCRSHALLLARSFVGRISRRRGLSACRMQDYRGGGRDPSQGRQHRK